MKLVQIVNTSCNDELPGKTSLNMKYDRRQLKQKNNVKLDCAGNFVAETNFWRQIEKLKQIFQLNRRSSFQLTNG